MKDYSSLVKRINKAIDKAANKVAKSQVHIVDVQADTSALSGLVVILAELPQTITQTSPPEEISA